MLWLVILVILLERYIYIHIYIYIDFHPKSHPKKCQCTDPTNLVDYLGGVLPVKLLQSCPYLSTRVNLTSKELQYTKSSGWLSRCFFFCNPCWRKKMHHIVLQLPFRSTEKPTRTEICQEAGDALKPFFWTSTMKVFGRIQRPNECSKSTLVTFHYTGWLTIRIVFFS